jgi:hypothetical protein
MGSVDPGFAIMIAIPQAFENSMLNWNQAQIFYCMMFIDFLDDVVTGY